MNFVVVFLLVVIAVLVLAGLVERRNPARREQPGLILDNVSSPSGKLTFRKPHPDDVNQLVALSRQPHSMKANGWSEKTALDHEETLRSSRFDAFARGAVLGELASGEIVGVASLGLKPGTRNEFSLGIQMDAARQGEGLGTEIMAAMILATRAATEHEIWVGTATTNTAMRTIMKHLGYQPEPGTQPYFAPDGTTFDALWYRCGRDHHPPRPAKKKP